MARQGSHPAPTDLRIAWDVKRVKRAFWGSGLPTFGVVEEDPCVTAGMQLPTAALCSPGQGKAELGAPSPGGAESGRLANGH